MPTNWAQRKQNVQYAWHVCPWLGKNSVVSRYLCCMPSMGSPVEHGHVVRHLPRGVGVELQAHALDLALERRLRAVVVAPSRTAGDPLVLVVLEHPALRERELEDRVVGHPVPVDQLVADVPVRPERQHARDGLDRLAEIRRPSPSTGTSSRYSSGSPP
jgi:hypothetical protein